MSPNAGAEIVIFKDGYLRFGKFENSNIAFMGRWHVEEELEQGSVVPILESYWVEPKPVWIYYSSRDNLPKRTRLFIDFMVDGCKQALRLAQA